MFQENISVAFHTLGCKLNFAETSTVARQFSNEGFTTVNFEDSADVYVLNTCSVTDNADKECRKLVRKVLRQNPAAFVIVMGCYAQLKPQEIVDIEGVDLVLGAQEKFKLFEHITSFEKRDYGHLLAGKIEDVVEFRSSYSLDERTRAYLKVQDGCDYSCSFCTIPMARGASRSDLIANIVKQAQEIGEAGAKEIVLTGVNIGDFGKESKEKLIHLIQALDKVKSIERFRISSIEPNLLTDEIIEFVAHSQRFMPHFHIPLQSGNNKQLATMRRRYKRELYQQRVEKIKSVMPHACIGVDVIVGFPGETDEDFQVTYDFINSLDISYLHVFTYSERANTLAIEMPEIIPQNIRSQRNKRLTELSLKKKNYFYSQFLNQSRKVLFEGKSNNVNNGFTDNYIKIKVHSEENLENNIIEVEMNEIDSNLNVISRISEKIN